MLQICRTFDQSPLEQIIWSLCSSCTASPFFFYSKRYRRFYSWSVHDKKVCRCNFPGWPLFFSKPVGHLSMCWCLLDARQRFKSFVQSLPSMQWYKTGCNNRGAEILFVVGCQWLLWLLMWGLKAAFPYFPTEEGSGTADIWGSCVTEDFLLHQCWFLGFSFLVQVY